MQCRKKSAFLCHFLHFRDRFGLIGFIDYVENRGGLTNATVTKAIFCVKRVLISKNFKAFLIGKGFNLP